MIDDCFTLFFRIGPDGEDETSFTKIMGEHNGVYCMVGFLPFSFISLVIVADTRPISHRVGRSVGLSHFALFAFLGILRVEKFVFEHAPAQIITAPAQIITAPAQTITAPAQIITAPAQPSGSGAVVYMALFSTLRLFSHTVTIHRQFLKLNVLNIFLEPFPLL